MVIAVASGKGGTGKTTVATSLALALAESGRQVACLDCDVEAPNAHLFLRPALNSKKQVDLLIPEVDADVCTGCGDCAEACQFHAIVTLGGKTLVFPELCHGCGSCTLVCPEKAITEIPKPLGYLESGRANGGIFFAHGILNIGEPMAVPVISQLKDWQEFPQSTISIIDAPPGASCPVVESLRGSDFVLLITEPTPFGLHDLRLAVQLTRELGIPAGVIVNRDGIGDDGIEAYCRESDLPILMRIPFGRELGANLAQGKTLVEAAPEYKQMFRDLYSRIMVILDESGARV
ncbi:MAG: ATP-binding protein [Anaerolineales bacterium]|nr:ATP-binding protein [Anaerolineales bacterium]